MTWEEFWIISARIFVNLGILIIIVPSIVFTWWYLVRRVNKSMGLTSEKLHKVMDLIYTDPKAAAFYRIGVLLSLAFLVAVAYSRPF